MINHKASIDDANRALAPVSRTPKDTLSELQQLVRDAGGARAALTADVAGAGNWAMGVEER